MSAPAPGTTLAGKYLVEQVLGEGGMGVVVAARHLQLDQRVAIKFLLPSALANPTIVERFAREARAAAKIRGEHVARVIDVGQFDDGLPYIVMEFLEGQDLGRLLATQGPLPFTDTVRYILETCEALAEAHGARIVHRDLKPANMFLAKRPDKRSIIKVLDFGISKMEGTGSGALTQTAGLMGTAYYMSPEQLTNPKGVDQRSDIWALGVIMYELLGGRPPFDGETVAGVVAQILQNQPAPLASLRPDLPPGLAAVIARCMQSRVEDRFENVARLAEALAPFASPTDRLSVEAVSRVLGESLPPPGVVPAVAPGVARTVAMPTPQSVPVTPLGDVAGAATQGSAPLTAQGMTASVAGLPAARRPGLIAGAVVGFAAIAGLSAAVAFAFLNTPEPTKTGAGLVAPPPSDTGTQAGTAAATATATTTATATATATATPTATATATATATPTARAGTTTARATASAAASASAAAPATATVAPTATATAATTSSTGKGNPLNMGLK